MPTNNTVGYPVQFPVGSVTNESRHGGGAVPPIFSGTLDDQLGVALDDQAGVDLQLQG